MNPVGTLGNTQVIINGVLQPQQCANYHCENKSEYLESPFCAECIWSLWAHIDVTQPEAKKSLARQGRVEEIVKLEAQREKSMADGREELRQARRTEPGEIYYLRVGDLIKIGYTSNLQQRMKQYPPNSTLLAHHPGTRETERHMHHKFLHRVAKGREWFEPCDEITQHIKQAQQWRDTSPQQEAA